MVTMYKFIYFAPKPTVIPLAVGFLYNI